ncbi:dTMP kinase [Paenibacillus medicaginis]|uniref:Thymidylate kinase n=1 Tax=Paenibacillus medicaginis TaxID=1470560 RepID=A0ABV5BZ86_9BACL
MNGKLLAVEGISGAGKTTLAHKLVDILTSNGLKAVYNHGAFSFTDVGRTFKNYTRTTPELFSSSYYIADLVQNTLLNIKPLLQDGYIIVQDRYYDSIISYVLAGGIYTDQKIDIQPIVDLYLELDLLIEPDLFVWCHAPQQTIINRLSHSDSSELQHHRYINHPDFILLVQQQFQRLFEKKANTTVVLDTQDGAFVDTVYSQILHNIVLSQPLKK